VIEVTEEQVLYFRACRGHLVGPGAANATVAAGAIIGAQSQQLPTSLHALSLRTKGRPTAAAQDWRAIVAARAEWQGGARGGPMPTDAALEKALAAMRTADRPVTRSDIIDVAPTSFVKAIGERAAAANMDPKRLAASPSPPTCPT
jgi:hypothetical protein